jgi:hypothetical protein
MEENGGAMSADDASQEYTLTQHERRRANKANRRLANSLNKEGKEASKNNQQNSSTGSKIQHPKKSNTFSNNKNIHKSDDTFSESRKSQVLIHGFRNSFSQAMVEEELQFILRHFFRSPPSVEEVLTNRSCLSNRGHSYGFIVELNADEDVFQRDVWITQGQWQNKDGIQFTVNYTITTISTAEIDLIRKGTTACQSIGCEGDIEEINFLYSSFKTLVRNKFPGLNYSVILTPIVLRAGHSKEEIYGHPERTGQYVEILSLQLIVKNENSPAVIKGLQIRKFGPQLVNYNCITFASWPSIFTLQQSVRDVGIATIPNEIFSKLHFYEVKSKGLNKEILDNIMAERKLASEFQTFQDQEKLTIILEEPMSGDLQLNIISAIEAKGFQDAEIESGKRFSGFDKLAQINAIILRHKEHNFRKEKYERLFLVWLIPRGDHMRCRYVEPLLPRSIHQGYQQQQQQ